MPNPTSTPDAPASLTAERAEFLIRYYEMRECHADELRGLAALRAERDEAQPVAWQPIETAPKDGRTVLAYVAGLGMGQMTLYYMDGYWRELANGMGLKIDPTHWMPLPPSPTPPADPAQWRQGEEAKSRRSKQMTSDYERGRIAGINEAGSRLALWEKNAVGEEITFVEYAIKIVSALLPPIAPAGGRGE